MTYRGIVRDGVVLLEQGAQIANGTPVRVEPMPGVEGVLDPLFRMNDLAAATGVHDLATNIDHYLCGHPKVEDGK